MDSEQTMYMEPINLANFDKSPTSSRVIQGLRYGIASLPLIMAIITFIYTKTQYGDFYELLFSGIGISLYLCVVMYALLIVSIYVIKIVRRVNPDEKIIVLSNGSSMTEYQYKELLAKQKSYKILFFPFRVTWKVVCILCSIILAILAFFAFCPR